MNIDTEAVPFIRVATAAKVPATLSNTDSEMNEESTLFQLLELNEDSQFSATPHIDDPVD